MIDTKEHTAAYKIFHYPFYFKVPAMFTYSELEIQDRGIPTTGDATFDRVLAEEPMNVRGTIKQMVDYRKEGAQITLNNPKEDSVRLYEIIVEHLGDVKQQLEQSLNVQLKDTEFLRELDALASDVYVIARHYIKTAGSKNSPLGIFERKRRFGLQSKRPSKIQIDVEKEHKNMSEGLSIKAMERKKPWQ